MEDEHRPQPSGWVRQFDDREQHQFFVDTKANPPRSIWHHPYDDEQYLSTLSSEQRERIQAEEADRMYHDHTDDEGHSPSKATGGKSPSHNAGKESFPNELPPRESVSGSSSKKGFGEKFKQKITGQTKEERQKERELRDQQEREYYEAHQKFRQCLQQAQVTGQPQYFAKDRDGKDIYIEPPNMGMGMGGYGNRASGYNPYSSGPYTNPNARFIRPSVPYGGRPMYGGGMYGGGYGGGYGGYGGYGGRGYGYGGGMGMGMPIAAGALGGMMLGGLMF